MSFRLNHLIPRSGPLRGGRSDFFAKPGRGFVLPAVVVGLSGESKEGHFSLDSPRLLLSFLFLSVTTAETAGT